MGGPLGVSSWAAHWQKEDDAVAADLSAGRPPASLPRPRPEPCPGESRRRRAAVAGRLGRARHEASPGGSAAAAGPHSSEGTMTPFTALVAGLAMPLAIGLVAYLHGRRCGRIRLPLELLHELRGHKLHCVGEPAEGVELELALLCKPRVAPRRARNSAVP